MPPFAYFAAKVVMSMIFSGIVVALLLVLGFSFGGVRLPALQVAKLLGTLIAGSLPFSAMGLAIGYFAGPNSAPPTINLIYLPMSFCSGLWCPSCFYPSWCGKLRWRCRPITFHNWPRIVGAGRHESAATHWEVLLAFTLICLGVARIGSSAIKGSYTGRAVAQTVRHYAESGGKELSMSAETKKSLGWTTVLVVFGSRPFTAVPHGCPFLISPKQRCCWTGYARCWETRGIAWRNRMAAMWTRCKGPRLQKRRERFVHPNDFFVSALNTHSFPPDSA